MVLLLVTGTLLAAFSTGAAVQTMFVYHPLGPVPTLFGDVLPEFTVRLSVNLGTSALVLVLCVLFAIERRPRWIQAALAIGISLLMAVIRYALQLALRIDTPMLHNALLAVLSALFVGALSLALGLVLVATRRRLRQRERDYARQETRASGALAALMAEELRVRREVAEELHGTVQGRVVYVQAGLERLAERLEHGQGGADAAVALRRLTEDLDDIRERDVRELSKLLYPSGVNIGVAHALRVLVRHVPETIDIAFQADAALSASDPLEVAGRVAVVRGAEEGLTNALRHGRAACIRVELSMRGDALLLTVDDDGRGLGTDIRWEGLARTAERIGALGGEVHLVASGLGGARLAITLPVPG
jgi:signal transduction histidine kinase